VCDRRGGVPVGDEKERWSQRKGIVEGKGTEAVQENGIWGGRKKERVPQGLRGKEEKGKGTSHQENTKSMRPRSQLGKTKSKCQKKRGTNVKMGKGCVGSRAITEKVKGNQKDKGKIG